MERAEMYRLLLADVYELAGTSRRTSESIARAANQTVARWHVLSVLSEPATAAGAARRLGLSRQSVHRVCGELIRDGLVEAMDNPDHQTSPLLRLTPEGCRVLDQLVERADADRARLLDRAAITSEQLTSARVVIQAAISALDEHSGPVVP
ncbi:MarR family transcriptional regulator [Williamsia sp. 1135]|uniref:MarR family winged helix-turn-helix transcriptional regulator n=1 Tax=Williamsia sp. 1135 TaxID=1889262 RepID=UPI0019815F5B|nr:MarR family transcriptional regulator [Williamsia sp. 1135]